MVLAKTFTGSDFNALNDVQKQYWLYGFIDATAQIAAAKDNTKGQCIANWYYGPLHAKNKGLIFAAMQKYHNKRATAVLVALLEHACGSFRKG